MSRRDVRESFGMHSGAGEMKTGEAGRGALPERRGRHCSGRGEDDGMPGGGSRSRRGSGVRRGVMAAALMLLPVVASAQLDEAGVGQQVVTVRVYKSGDPAGEWAGVVVNGEGDVLTSAAVLAAGRRVTVLVQGEEGELEATVQWREDDAWGLGVVRVEGLQRAGLVVSEAEVTAGTRVFAVTPGAGFVAGAVGDVGVRSVGNEEVRFLQHNAMISASGYGSPVVNECGQVVGLNVPHPRREPGRLPREKEPKDTVFALDAEELVLRLGRREVEFERVAEGCAPAEARAEEREREAREAQEQASEAQRRREEAEEQKAEAQRRQEEAEERARQAEADVQASEQEKQEARDAAERAQRETQAARRHAEEMKQAAAVAEQAVEEAARRVADARASEEAQRRRSEQVERFAQWGGAAGAALLVLILLFWALSARRKRRAIRSAQARAAVAEREAAEARQRAAAVPESAPFDCILTGRNVEGVALALNLRRDALGASGGAVIGRDPAESSHVVVDPGVSRAHARVYADGGVLHIEDLGSTNGTFLNEERLVEGRRMRVRDGDELALGSVTFRVELRT